MRRRLIALALLFFTIPVFAQHRHPVSDGSLPVTLLSGLGNVHHPVSTTNVEAQRFFDQGLALVYAFNHAEAIRSFQRAAELDPKLAMAHWGIGLALGPNINADVDPSSEKAAYDSAQKALAMESTGAERAYIEALGKRYSIAKNADLQKLNVDYKNAMGELSRKYPDDLDAATLYAESGMDLRPWKLWSKDGTPSEGTEEIMKVLQSVLSRNPDHIGANHYYIHTVEASPHPEWALPCAERLGRLVKTAGHLVHMPSHVFMRVGDYARASESNREAAEVDREYIVRNNVKGIYAAGYYSHNLHFLTIAASMQGRFAESYAASEKLNQNVIPYLGDIPPLESFLPTSTMVLVRFRKWDEILKAPLPAEKFTLATSVAHWARAMSFVAKGQDRLAVTERDLFAASEKKIPGDFQWGLNSVSSILPIAHGLLNAKIAMAKGDKELAIEELRKAVTAEDALAYDEPPGWFLPARESLGGTLMLAGKYEEAEQVFREDLQRNRRNGRSLFGLEASLRAQNKNDAAQFVKIELDKAWKDADVQLKIEDL